MNNCPKLTLFLADPIGGASIADDWRNPLGKFCGSLKDHLGERPKYRFWFYRNNYTGFYALDLEGEKDDCALTFIETNDLKSEKKVFSIGECMVFDAVDAVYLASYLVAALDAQPKAPRSGERNLTLQMRNVK
ncbi:MAG: hypothetical protein LBE75_05165 [Burkholderiales bacterium]|jgi:hypothetical protein|nr:hypothetical protein [Burkholderiales bacterium]